MTLSSPDAETDEEGARGTGSHSGADVLRQESFITENIRWNATLETALIGTGLLDTKVTKTTSEKVHDVIHCVAESANKDNDLVKFLDLLENHGNKNLATVLRHRFTKYEDDSSGTEAVSRSYDGDLDTGMALLRRQLAEAETLARAWRIRAAQLEAAQVSKPPTSGDDEQQTAVALGRLKAEKDVLHSQLKQRDKGLKLWQEKEDEYTAKIESLKARIDEMAEMIRARDKQLDQLKQKESTYKEKIDHMKYTVNALSKRRAPVTEPVKALVLPDISKKGMSKTLPAKFPTVVQYEAGAAKPPKFVPRPPAGPRRPSSRLLPPLISPRAGDTSPRNKKVTALDDVDGGATGDVTDNGQACTMTEKWIDPKGGEVRLGNISLHIPPKSVDIPVQITMTNTTNKRSRQSQIDAAGLGKYVAPGVQLRLQPHGYQFLRPVYLEIRGAGVDSPSRLLLMHKEVDPHKDLPWTDITTSAAPKLNKENAIFSIQSFSIIETVRLLLPVASVGLGLATGLAIGLRVQVCSLFNNKTCACQVHVYHRPSEPYLTVHCSGQDNESNNNATLPFTGGEDYNLVGYQSSKFPFCDKENLFFYYNTGSECAGAFPFDYEKSNTKGQVFRVPLPNQANSKKFPTSVYIRRRIANRVAEEDVCVVNISQQGVKHTFVESKWEEVLRLHRMDLVHNLDVQNVINPLRQENVVNSSEEEEIMALPNRRKRAARLLDVVSSKGKHAFFVLCQSMDDDYDFLSELLRASYNRTFSLGSNSTLSQVIQQESCK